MASVYGDIRCEAVESTPQGTLTQTVSLQPTTALLTKRYHVAAGMTELSNVLISPGQFSSGDESHPRYLPPSWFEYCNPEGRVYFYRATTPAIVTEENLHRKDILEQISVGVAEIEKSLQHITFKLPETAELCIELADVPWSYRYYFVDHATRTEFWLEALDSDTLEISEVASPSHLKIALEDHYWNHVEHFPMHRDMPSETLDRLINVFSQGLCDQITSTTSPFSFSPSDAAQYLDLLTKLKPACNTITDGNAVFVIARLWAHIARVQYAMLYGQERVRFCRDQKLLMDSDTPASRLGTVLSRALLGVPGKCVEELDELWVDQIVYINIWTDFLNKRTNEWKATVPLSFAVLISSLLFMVVPNSSHTLGPMAVLTSTASLASGIVHLHQFDGIQRGSTEVAVAYIQRVRSERFGFWFTGFAYALPKSLLLWSLVLLALQAATTAIGSWGVRFAFYLVPVAAVMVFLVLRVSFAHEGFSLAGFWKIPRRQRPVPNPNFWV